MNFMRKNSTSNESGSPSYVPKFQLALAATTLLFCAVEALAQSSPPAATGLASIHVPDGFTVELASVPGAVSFPMCAAFDDRGRLFVTESSGKDLSGEEMVAAPECTIRLLEDRDGDGVYETSKVFADKLSLPMGVLWHDGALYVASPPEFLKFQDTDGDGVADKRDVILKGWKVLNTASLHGPFMGPDGWLYLTHGRHGYKIETKEGPTLEGLAARIWRCRPDGTGLERVCGGGFDNPVELIFTPPGDIIGTMTYFTDPRDGQRDALLNFVEGGVYPKPHSCVSEFKLTGDFMPVMTKFARIAPAGLLRYRGDSFGKEFEGNLFSAQFNPHRVQRHVMTRDGATFKTEDSDFLTSTDPDFHPTDVMEDADGSLLVVETGGWYVDACPLSRVSRPDVRGMIYRVRKTGAKKVDDPWGTKIDWKETPKDLAKHLDDPRFAIQSRALESLVKKGEASAPELRQELKHAKNSGSRVAALWGLFRIGGDEARGVIRSALRDSDPQVRQAAARAAGLEHDAQAANSLAEMARKDEPAVRRQACEALGQIGGPSAAPALLRAAARADDRFIEHAAIYSLIRLGASRESLAALDNKTPKVRKAALVALDQMDSKPLPREALKPFLADADPDLRKSALWVASHHPDWSDEVLDYLKGQIDSPKFKAAEAAPVREALLAFAADAKIKGLVADELNRLDSDSNVRLFLFDVMDQSALQPLPPAWVDAIGRRLKDSDADVRARAIALIRSRAIGTLDRDLKTIADNGDESANLRVAALGVILPRQGEVNPAQFDFLTSNVKSSDPGLRITATNTLAKSKLEPDQLLRLATGTLAGADPLILQSLLGAFEGASDEAAGKAVVAALVSSKANPNLIGEERLQKVLAKFPPSVKSGAAPLLAQIESEREARVNKLATLEPLLGAGDVGRGRHIFFGEKAACSTCHAIGKEGGNLGPDLTTIGEIRSGRDLLEAVLFPSASFVPGYEPMRIEMKSDTQAGVISRQTPEAIYLRTSAKDEIRIPRDAIKSVEPSAVSVMPEGLDTSLTQAELIDLLAFLQAQNGEEWLLPGKRKNKQQASN